MNLRGDDAHPIIAPFPAVYDLEWASPRPVRPLTLYDVPLSIILMMASDFGLAPASTMESSIAPRSVRAYCSPARRSLSFVLTGGPHFTSHVYVFTRR
jgi:hypothetical protein